VTYSVFANLRKRIKLTTLLKIVLSSAVFLSVVVFGMVATTIITNTMQTLLIEKNKITAIALSEQVSNLIKNYEQALSLLYTDKFQTKELVNEIFAKFIAFEKIFITDKNGIIVKATGSGAELGYDVSRQDYFTYPSKTGAMHVSAAVTLSSTYSPSVVISMPSENGYIIAYLNLASLANFIKGLGNPEYDIFAVVDYNGFYIAHTNMENVYKRETIAVLPEFFEMKSNLSGSLVSESIFSESVLLDYAKISNTNWYVFVAQKTSTVFAITQNMNFQILLLVIICCLVSLLCLDIVIRMAKKDIQVLSDYGDTLASGDYNKSLEYIGYKDFKSLSNNFNTIKDAVVFRENSLKEINEKISQSLAEKEILLREIHHRVKNNMQMVISLLSLQAATLKTVDEKKVFIDSMERVRVMAMIHELLYESGNLSRIDFSEYIRTIADSLIISSVYKYDRPLVEYDLDQMFFDIDASLPGGLIVNEIVMNACKYAFLNGEKMGRLRIVLKKLSDTSVYLEISDNGEGIPASVSVENSTSLGMKLIVALISQLQGTWTLDNENGTKWKIFIKPFANRSS